LLVSFPLLAEVRASMASRQDTMMNPSIEELLDRAGSKFSLVTLSSMRARQINAYFNQLGEGLGSIVPPQVTSVARKPLSIAFEEIAGDKIVPVRSDEQPPEGGTGADGGGAPAGPTPAPAPSDS
jgi:DNA-directed RNA polymerase subunit omega